MGTNDILNKSAVNIIDRMDSISLSEMDSVSLMDRVDTKYVLNEEKLQRVLQEVNAQYRVLSIEQVRLSPYITLYFDSPGLDCFLEHHNGKLNRRKFRMRQYLSTGVCFLEVKRKNNKGRTDKRRIPIQEIKEDFSDEATAFLESLVGTQIDLKPKLWTKFSRITLVDRDFRERVTLDLDLDFRAGEQNYSLPGVVIAEVKQQSDNRGSAMREQLRSSGVRPLRVSKYCLGTMLLEPNIKSNRFKSKLRTIRSLA